MFLGEEGMGRDRMVDFYFWSFFFSSPVPSDLWYCVPCAFGLLFSLLLNC